MNVVVNGETRDLEPECTVEALLAGLLPAGTACAVEVNRAVVPKAEHGVTVLGEGDTIEIVTLVGGG